MSRRWSSRSRSRQTRRKVSSLILPSRRSPETASRSAASSSRRRRWYDCERSSSAPSSASSKRARKRSFRNPYWPPAAPRRTLSPPPSRDELLEPVEGGVGGADARLRLLRLVERVGLEAEEPNHERQCEPLADEGREDHREGEKDDEVALRERRARIGDVGDRQGRGERDGAAHPGPADERRFAPLDPRAPGDPSDRRPGHPPDDARADHRGRHQQGVAEQRRPRTSAERVHDRRQLQADEHEEERVDEEREDPPERLPRE